MKTHPNVELHSITIATSDQVTRIACVRIVSLNHCIFSLDTIFHRLIQRNQPQQCDVVDGNDAWDFG